MNGDAVAETAQFMLWELEAGWLEVVLIPYDRSRCRRVAVSHNAQWYQEFCADHLTKRSRGSRLTTYIKRSHTIRALNRIIDGTREGVYVERLLPYVKKQYEQLTKEHKEYV